jgi:hypothetical protein
VIDRPKKLPAFFYETSGGNQPVRDWIKGLSREDRQIVGRDVQDVESRMDKKKKGKIGSSFDSFLAEEGILETCEEQALKQILADQIMAAMEKNRITKSAMAARMQTSRRALDRLLDPTNTSVTLHTMQRAAVAVGRQLRLELV